MSQADWALLSKEQRMAVAAWRDRISKLLIAETESFEQEHPELRLNYRFTSEPLLREKHPVVYEEL